MSTINKDAVLNPFSDLTANILDYVPRATTSEFGIVAIGSGINVDALGRIYLDTQEYSDRLTAIEAQAASSLATQKSEVAAAIAQVNLAQSQTITALTLEVNNLKTNLTDSITATKTDLINRADQLAQNVTNITQQLTQDKAAFTKEIQDALVYLENASSVASALRTPRKIQGVDFDGTKDISLPVFTTQTDGLVPKREGATSTKYLREDGSWVTPPNTTYASLTQANAEAGTSTTANLISAKVLKDTILYHTPIVTDIAGNAGTATKLATPRTISLTGKVTGSVSFDGSANASITTTVTGLGVANGIATLDASGKVPSTQLPSYVDDVLEYLNVAAFPTTGETGKIYVETTGNTTYRWSGSAYVKITSGEVSSVAGKTGVVTLNKADVGLESIDNTPDINKSVASAAKLTNSRKINNVDFNGENDINIEAPLRWVGNINSIDQVNSSLEDGKYSVLNVPIAGLYGYGFLVVMRNAFLCHQTYYPHSGAGENNIVMAVRQTWDTGANWSNWSLVGTRDNTKLSLTGGTLTGNLITKTPLLAQTIDELGIGDSTPIRVPEIDVPLDVSGYIPFIHGSMLTAYRGYKTHISIGGYRGSSTWDNSGAYIAIGGNDANPTESFRFLYGRRITNSTGPILLEGNAATATKLATARTINGVAFDGTANITIADNTKLPLTGGTLTGSLNVSDTITVTGVGNHVNAFKKLIQASTTTDGGYIAVGNHGSDRGYLELGATDDPDAAIYARKRNNANTILEEAVILGSDGNTSFPKSVLIHNVPSGYGTCGLVAGNGDNAAYVACNIDITSWFGVGIKSSNSGERTVVFNARTGDISNKGSINTVGAVNGRSLGVNNTAGAGHGLSLYEGAVDGLPHCGIAFAQTSNFSTHGYVNGDWATYFTMTRGANRGWIFKSHDQGNVASISSQGLLYVPTMKMERSNFQIISGTNHTVTYDYATRIVVIEMKVLSAMNPTDANSPFKWIDSRWTATFTLPIVLTKRISAEFDFSNTPLSGYTNFIYEAAEWHTWVAPANTRGSSENYSVTVDIIRWTGAANEPMDGHLTVVGFF